MADVMSFAEVHDQLVELLAPRTVLSLLHAVQTTGIIGTPGDQGTHGSNGQSLVDTTWTGLFGVNDQSNASRLSGGVTDPGGKTS